MRILAIALMTASPCISQADGPLNTTQPLGTRITHSVEDGDRMISVEGCYRVTGYADTFDESAPGRIYLYVNNERTARLFHVNFIPVARDALRFNFRARFKNLGSSESPRLVRWESAAVGGVPAAYQNAFNASLSLGERAAYEGNYETGLKEVVFWVKHREAIAPLLESPTRPDGLQDKTSILLNFNSTRSILKSMAVLQGWTQLGCQ